MTNLLVQFLSTPRGDSKRFEMLSVIGSILRLSDEDKVKIGLMRQSRADAAPKSPVGSESLTDLWISFLLKVCCLILKAFFVK
jgi:hypothetical protein